MENRQILFLLLNLGAGGAEKQALLLRDGFIASGHSVDIFAISPEGLWKDKATTVSNIFGPEKSRFRLFRAFRSLRKILIGGDYDIVIGFLWLPMVLAGIANLSIGRKIPVVWSAQSDLPNDFSKKKAGLIRKWLVQHFLIKSIDSVVFVSEGIRKRTNEYFKFGSQKVFLIPNAIEPKEIDEKLSQVSDLPEKKAIRLISVGRLFYQKGCENLLEVAGLLKVKGVKYELYIIGEGELRKELEDRIVEIGLEECVFLPGYSENPYALLNSADIFVSSSRWETFGIVIAEAMYCGLPVVATRTDGAETMVKDGINGYICEQGDFKSMAMRLEALIKDEELRSKMGQESRKIVKNYTIDKVADKYLEVIDETINSNH